MIPGRPTTSTPPPPAVRPPAPAIIGLGRPLRDDFAVVSSHYNFANFAAPRRNLHRWLRSMERDGVPTYGTEIYLKGQTPQTSGHPGWRQIMVGPDSVLSQKEALVNAAVRAMPDEIEAFAEVDADLWFDDPAWIDATLDMLDSHPCGQPFAEAVWTGREGEVELVRPAAAAAGIDIVSWTGHPGFSWAFRREFFEALGGWYDRAILGGADLLWAASAIGGADPAAVARRVGIGANPASYLVYHARVAALMKDARPGFAPGRVWHEFHGSRHDRRYGERPTIMAGLDPSGHLRLRDDGVLEWSPEAPAGLKRRVAGYFASRKEDA